MMLKNLFFILINLLVKIMGSLHEFNCNQHFFPVFLFQIKNHIHQKLFFEKKNYVLKHLNNKTWIILL